MDGAKRTTADDSTLEGAIAQLRTNYAEWVRTRRFGDLGILVKLEAGVIVGPAVVTTALKIK
jgi:hypothetical protein